MPFLAPALGTIATNLAFAIGASVLSGAISSVLGGDDQSSTSQITTSRGFSFDMSVGEVLPVSCVIGNGRARGHLVYVNEHGDNNEWLQLMIAIGHAEHDGLAKFLLDGKIKTLSGSNADPMGMVVDDYVDSAGTPRMWVKTYSGAAGQVADPELVAHSNPEGRWGDFHKATGVAYMIVTMHYEEVLYKQHIPQIGSVWRGVKLYNVLKDTTVGGSGTHRWGDPSTYEFTANPVVIRWNFRRGIYVGAVRIIGMGLSFFAQDLAAYMAAANVCDEDFYDPVSEQIVTRYEYGREITDDEEKLSVLRELDAAYAGSSYRRGGADVPLPGAQMIAVGTLRDIDRLDRRPVRADKRGSASAKKTAWHGKFVSEDKDYNPAPFEIRVNADLETSLGGRRSVTLDQPYETNQVRAQARAEIAMRREMFPATRTETFGPIALRYEPGDVITRACDWGDIKMMITGRKKLAGNVGVELTLQQWDNAIVPASGDSFVTIPRGPGVGQNNPTRLVTLPGFAVAEYSQAANGAVAAGIRATYSEITDNTVDQTLVKYWPADGDENTQAQYAFGTRFGTAIAIPGLLPFKEYACRGGIVTNPYRYTVLTDVLLVTTGAEVAPKVADGAVDAAAIAADILAGIVSVITSGPGSIAEQIDGIRQDYERLAASVSDISTIQERTRVELVAQLNTARASITEEQLVRVSESEAAAAKLEIVDSRIAETFATVTGLISTVASAVEAEAIARQAAVAVVAGNLAGVSNTMEARTGAAGSLTLSLQQLTATFNAVTVNGTVGFQLASTPAGVEARYAIAIDIGGEIVTALNLDLVDDGFGGYEGRVAVVASSFYFLDTAGAYVSAPFAIEGGFVKITSLRFENMTSIDGTSVVIEGRSANDPRVEVNA